MTPQLVMGLHEIAQRQKEMDAKRQSERDEETKRRRERERESENCTQTHIFKWICLQCETTAVCVGQPDEFIGAKTLPATTDSKVNAKNRGLLKIWRRCAPSLPVSQLHISNAETPRSNQMPNFRLNYYESLKSHRNWPRFNLFKITNSHSLYRFQF